MKFILSILFLVSCASSNNEDHFLILQYVGESDKPIPILELGNTSSLKKIPYSKNFIVSDDILDKFNYCVTTSCELKEKAHNVYKITSISKKLTKYYYINDVKKLKPFFECLQNVCYNEQLISILSEIKIIRVRLNI